MSSKKKSKSKSLDSKHQSEIDELKDAFSAFDKDSDGTITSAELGTVLRAMNKTFTDAELKKIVSKFDVDGDGQIDFSEFLTMMTKRERKEVDEMKDAFLVFDKDNDGNITGRELMMVMKALGEDIDKDTIDLMIASVDLDGDGTIDFHEFKKMMVDGPVVL